MMEGKHSDQCKKKVFCCCCGEEGHFLDEFEKSDEIPKEEWAVKKGMSMFVNSCTYSSGDNRHLTGGCMNEQNQSTSSSSNNGEQNNNNDSNWLGMQMYCKPCEKDKEEIDMNECIILNTWVTFSSFHNRELLVKPRKAENPI